MITISNRDFDILVTKLPMLLQAAPRSDNIRYREALRQLQLTHKKLIRKSTPK